ncbi:hypothetical protein LJN55_14695 [Erwinia rhapontici]|uniref:hypothetical protein n=1 Tax=Erwinia rhapontici TaxID=55212 RepID=UPI001D0DADD8|nr:hypothetical protein [Erwinia rhapontici]UDQ78713.1 hypothetical protein LJN55_14695 [Erwinia rhapontici]
MMSEKNERRENEIVHEKKQWINFEYRLKKCGSWFLILFVLCGMAGLFSKGYLSEGHISDRAGTMTIEYERFGRVISDADMKITFTPTGIGVTRVTLGGDFTENYELLTLHPQPLRALTDGTKLILEFQQVPSSHSQSVWLGLQPRRAGVGRTIVTLGDGAPISFFQLVYP